MINEQYHRFYYMLTAGMLPRSTSHFQTLNRCFIAKYLLPGAKEVESLTKQESWLKITS